MGFKFASFGAATVPLSKIVVDKNLDLRPYGVTAAFCKAPMTPDVWPTKTLDWGDGPASEVVIREQISLGTVDTTINILTADTEVEVCVRVTVLSGATLRYNAQVRINEVNVYSLAGLPPGSSATTPPLILKPGDVLDTILASSIMAGSSARVELIYTGRVVGAKTFDLTDKWLALGIDMKGLDATIKIQGVEIPYEEYIKCFPIAPTELKIPGDWDWSQERPEIKVYKERIDWLEETRDWATETLDWGDVPPGDPILFTSYNIGKDTWTTLFTFDVPTGDTYKWRFTFRTTNANTGGKANFKITANGEEIFHVSDISSGIWRYDVIIPAGSTVTIQGSKTSGEYYVVNGSNVQNLGFVCGPKTFDLTGKWLALGIDMHGLDAMIEIQGELVPYTDYIKYFPVVKPTKLIIPGGWSYDQERPEIRVYKND